MFFPPSISNAPQKTPLRLLADRPIIKTEALLGLVSWLKQTAKVAASELERETIHEANTRATSEQQPVGSRSGSHDQQFVEAASTSGARGTAVPAQSDAGQTITPGGLNQGGRA